MKLPGFIPFEVLEIANKYALLNIPGINYSDIENDIIPAREADLFLMMHQEVKEYEQDEMEKENKKIGRKK